MLIFRKVPRSTTMMGVAMVLFSLCLVASLQIKSKNKPEKNSETYENRPSPLPYEQCTDEENISLISSSKTSYDAA